MTYAFFAGAPKPDAARGPEGPRRGRRRHGDGDGSARFLLRAAPRRGDQSGTPRRGLPAPLSGLRVGFMTDLHRSATVPHELIETAADGS